MIKYDEGQYNIWNSKNFLRIFQVLTRIRPEFLSCLEFCLEFRSEFGYVWILILNHKVLCWIKFRTQFSKNKLSSTHGSRPKNPEWEQRYLQFIRDYQRTGWNRGGPSEEAGDYGNVDDGRRTREESLWATIWGWLQSEAKQSTSLRHHGT